MLINVVYIFCRRRPNLLSLEEAWNVPISAEMTSRQQQQQQQLKQKQKMPHKSNSQKHALVRYGSFFFFFFFSRVLLTYPRVEALVVGSDLLTSLKRCIKFTPQDLQHLNGHSNNNTAAVPVTSTASATALTISSKRFKVN